MRYKNLNHGIPIVLNFKILPEFEAHIAMHSVLKVMVTFPPMLQNIVDALPT